jgi:hypothetical protein
MDYSRESVGERRTRRANRWTPVRTSVGDELLGGGVSGVAVRSIIRAVASAVTEPRSGRTNSRATVAGRATCVFDTRSNIQSALTANVDGQFWLVLHTEIAHATKQSQRRPFVSSTLVRRTKLASVTD